MRDVLVIAGPSAVGKTTVAHLLLEGNPKFEFVRSVTTRLARQDGFDKEYIYTDRAGFEEMIKRGEVLEYTEYAGNFYGTPRSEILRISGEGKIPLLILDLEGVKALSDKSQGINPCNVYLYDDIDVLEKRLYNRYIADSSTTEGMDKFLSRKNQNLRDYTVLSEYAVYFYEMIGGEKTPEKTAEKLAFVFERFASGEVGSSTDVTVRELEKQALNKQ